MLLRTETQVQWVICFSNVISRRNSIVDNMWCLQGFLVSSLICDSYQWRCICSDSPLFLNSSILSCSDLGLCGHPVQTSTDQHYEENTILHQGEIPPGLLLCLYKFFEVSVASPGYLGCDTGAHFTRLSWIHWYWPLTLTAIQDLGRWPVVLQGSPWGSASTHSLPAETGASLPLLALGVCQSPVESTWVVFDIFLLIFL